MQTLQNILSQQNIQTIGWTLINFIWQGTLIAFLLAIVQKFLRNKTSNTRYAIALLALALMVIAPIVTYRMVYHVPVAAIDSEKLANHPVQIIEPMKVVKLDLPQDNIKPIAPVKKSFTEKFIQTAESFLPHIVICWFVGVIILSVWHLGGWMQLQKLRSQMISPVPHEIKAKVAIILDRLKIKKAVSIFQSVLVNVPAVIGHFKPVILLPASALTGLSGQQIDAILAHELAHIKRCDYLINILQTVVEILGFYHPAVWWVSNKIRQERENCCDDIAVQITGDEISYARALTTMEEIRFLATENTEDINNKKLAVAASGGNLFQRIKRLLAKRSHQNEKTTWLPSFITFILIAALLIPMSLTLISCNQEKIVQHEMNQKLSKLDIDTATREDVIKVFGEPEEYKWGPQILKKENLPDQYIMVYPNNFCVWMVKDQIIEFRIEGTSDYVYGKGLVIGSSIEKAFDVLGQPTEIVEGRPNGFEDNVFYKDINGRKGHCYYARPEKKIRLWFAYDKVHSIYLTRSNFSAGPGRKLKNNELPKGSIIDANGHIIDKIDYPFVNDQNVLGSWKAVGFVQDMNAFKYDGQFPGKLFLREMLFKEGGRLISKNDNEPNGFPLKWTKDLIIYDNDLKTASAYTIKEIDNSKYMFVEWKTGDYTYRHLKPNYYVLKKVEDDSVTTNLESNAIQVYDSNNSLTNFLDNTGTEEGKGDLPSSWFQACVPADGLKMYRDSENVHSGKYSLAIENTHKYEETVCNNWAQNIQNIPVGSIIKVGAYIKTENADSVNICIQCWPIDDGNMLAFTSTNILKGDNDWVLLESPPVLVPAGTAKITVRAALTGTGKVWFDDIKVNTVNKKVEDGEQAKKDYSSVTIKEGVGFDDVILGDPNCTREFLIKKFGQPDKESTAQWLVYNNKYGFDFWLNDGFLTEIRLNPGFNGKLRSGISMHSSKEDVFKAYGLPVVEEFIGFTRMKADLQKLYIRSNDEPRISYMYCKEGSLLFWFKGDKINQFVVFPEKKDSNLAEVPPHPTRPKEPPPPPTPYEPPTREMVVYEVNKSVSDFPADDFSTPQAAYAAINRVSANGDADGWQRVSVKKLAETLAAEKNNGKMKTDPEWSQVLLYAKINEVRIWDNKKAIVMAELPQSFCSKKIKAPIDVRWLEFEEGKWLNSGNDRTWTIEEARAKFDNSCENKEEEKSNVVLQSADSNSPNDAITSAFNEFIKAVQINDNETLTRIAVRQANAYNFIEPQRLNAINSLQRDAMALTSYKGFENLTIASIQDDNQTKLKNVITSEVIDARGISGRLSFSFSMKDKPILETIHFIEDNGKELLLRPQILTTAWIISSPVKKEKVLSHRELSNEELKTFLNEIKNDKKAKILTSPKVLTNDGEQAILKTGDTEFRIKTTVYPDRKSLKSLFKVKYSCDGSQKSFEEISASMPSETAMMVRSNELCDGNELILIVQPKILEAGEKLETGVAAVDNVQPQKETTFGPRRPTGNCSISGKAVSAETNEPVANARMYLFCNETHDAIFINTASDGTFEFQNIPSGSFTLRSSHVAGYQDCVYDPENKSVEWPPFSLKDGEQRKNLIFKLKPAYSISGKILDENGRVPAEGFEVLAWLKKDGQKYDVINNRINSKDGTFLIDGLDGTPVYVMAINWQAEVDGNAYPPIYYPGTFSRDEAKLITFDNEKEIKNIEIKLKKNGGIVLEGTVTDEKGQPVSQAFVVVHHSDMLVDFSAAYTDQNGKYKIEALGPGNFLAHVDAVHKGYVRTRMPLEIKAGDKELNMNFKLNRGASISGKFVDENGDEWKNTNGHGNAVIPDSPAGTGSSSSFSFTNFRNKYRPKDSQRGSGGYFEPGNGDYNNSEMIFPISSTFIFQPELCLIR